MARPTYVIDTSVLLRGRDPPPGIWVTTPEADAEVSPGGKDARRFAMWKETGLQVRSPTQRGLDAVDDAALAAGNLGRLSDADRTLLALCRDLRDEAILLSDDHTMLDVAKRLGLRAQSLAGDGIEATMSWRPRCSGCGRWFESGGIEETRSECSICGSPVVAKPYNG